MPCVVKRRAYHHLSCICDRGVLNAGAKLIASMWLELIVVFYANFTDLSDKKIH